MYTVLTGKQNNYYTISSVETRCLLKYILPQKGGRRDNHEEESFSSYGNGCSYGSNAGSSWCSYKSW